MTPLKIARNESIPVVERIERLLTTETLGHRGFFEVLATIVERALSRVESPDPRSVAVVGVLRRHAAEPLSDCEIDTARCAASEAELLTIQRSAAHGAAWAAWASLLNSEHVAWYATNSAAHLFGDTERRQQLNDIIAALEAQSASAS